MGSNQLNNNKVLDGIHNFNSKKEVILRITKYCNQKCLFCFTNIDNKTSFSFDFLKEEVDKIIFNNLGENLDFVITGGEPTLNRDLFKIISYIYKKGFHITLQSNAVNFSDDFIKKIIKYSDSISFFISFHSHLPKIYDSITNSKLQFHLAVNGVKNILKISDNVTINLVCTKFNQNTIKGYFNFIGSNFYSINNKLKLNLSVMSNVYKYKYIDKLLIKFNDLVNEINESEEIIKFYNINIGSDFGGPCDLPFCLGNKLFYYKEDIHSLRVESDKYIDREKINECNKCKYKRNCSGIMKLYLEKYGNSEFQPISNE